MEVLLMGNGDGDVTDGEGGGRWAAAFSIY